tara:strand:+ start:6910 stop:7152 length:243 start_codon:yes stop_codon:yes gene_type:complete
MILFIKILLLLFLILFPILLHGKKARIECSIGLSMMLGISYEMMEVLINQEVYDKYQVLFCFGPIYISVDWLKKIGDYEA